MIATEEIGGNMRFSKHRNGLALLACSLALVSISCDSGSSTSNAKNESSYTVPDQIELTASVSRDANNGTVINGATNLPEGTKLGVELMNGGRATAQDFGVFVSSGNFHSAAFRKGTSPLPLGKQKVHIFTYFTTLWQSPAVLNLLGTGGSKLKSSGVIHSEDAQLIDGNKVLDYTADLIVPPLSGAAGKADVARPSAPSSQELKAIEIVKKAVLVVDGSRSSMNVEDGVQFYFGAPGIRMGDGWSATPTANDTFNVVLDFINGDGKGKESHDKAMWEVNLVTRKVLYRTKYAKDFSWIPDK
jgi:hypothetical protein